MSVPPSKTAERKIEETKNVISGVAEDISKGVPPSTQQLSEVISSTKDVVGQQLKEQPMPTYGTRVVQDVERILEDTQQLLEKNKDDKIQKIIMKAKEASESGEGIPASVYGKAEHRAQKVLRMEGEFNTTADYLGTIAIQIVQSPEFRAVLLEFINLVQSSFQLTIQQKKPPITEQLKKDVKEQQHRPLSHTMEETTEDIKEYVKDIAEDIQEGNIPVDKDQQHKLEKRWDELLRKVAKNRDWHRAARGMLYIFDELERQFQTFQKEIEVEAKKVTKEAKEPIQEVWHESRLLLVDFVGEKPVNDFTNAVNDLFRAVRDDAPTKQYFHRLREFIHDILEHPEKLDKEDYQKKFRTFNNQARELSNRWKHKDSFNRVTDSGRQLIEAIKNEPTTQQIAFDARKLGEHLLLDENGQPSLAVTQQAIQGLSGLLLPVMSTLLKGFPLPRLEGSNETYDWSFDSLVLKSPQTLLPEHFTLFFRSRVKVDVPTPTSADITHRLGASKALSEAEIVLRIQGFEIFLDDIQYFFRRKEFPKLEDTGVMKLSVAGASNFLEVVWYVGPSGLSVSDVRCIFDELNIRFKEATHDFILPLFTNLFRGTIKEKLEGLVEKYLGENMEVLSDQMNEAIDKAQKSASAMSKNVITSAMETSSTSASSTV